MVKNKKKWQKSTQKSKISYILLPTRLLMPANFSPMGDLLCLKFRAPRTYCSGSTKVSKFRY